MKFGEKLKKIRAYRNLSQEDLATILGTSKQVISRYENNQRTPKITVAQEYAEKLNLPLDFLIDDNQDTPAEKLTTKNDDELSQKVKERPKLLELMNVLSNTSDEGLDTFINLAKMIDKEKSKD